VKALARLMNRKPGIQNEDEFFVSAVLLPIIEKNGNFSILFEVRSNCLRRQPGEICFPGGKVEKPEMGRPWDSAVRETAEELGISPGGVKLLGRLDCLINPPGSLIYPFVGMLTDCSKVKPNPDEVEEVFWAPLSHFVKNPPAKSHVEVATRYPKDFPFDKVQASYGEEWQKRWTFPVYFYEYGERLIWGVTAKILYNFISTCWPAGMTEACS